MKHIKLFETFINESGSKKWYNDRKKWEKDRAKLTVSDDSDNWDKDADGKLISFWHEDRGEGWITK